MPQKAGTAAVNEMMLYFLILLCLTLLGIAGLQFTYMFYLDRLDKERKKRIRDLELHCKNLKQRLITAESRITEQNELIDSLYLEEDEEEQWAEVLEDTDN